jgi:hypothetical protein
MRHFFGFYANPSIPNAERQNIIFLIGINLQPDFTAARREFDGIAKRLFKN